MTTRLSSDETDAQMSRYFAAHVRQDKATPKLSAAALAEIAYQLYMAREDASELDRVTGELWEHYRNTPETMNAHAIINTWSQLYRLCRPGTEIMCVFLRSYDTVGGSINRVWKVLVTDGTRCAPITGYLLRLGIGHPSRDEHNTEIITSQDAAGLSAWISQALYGTAHPDMLRYSYI